MTIPDEPLIGVGPLGLTMIKSRATAIVRRVPKGKTVDPP